MFVSGIPLSERAGAKKRYERGDHWVEYKTYLDRTSALIPFPPQLYARMLVWLKRTVFLEFPMCLIRRSTRMRDRGRMDMAKRHMRKLFNV
jgi:hypothetical protein